MNFSKPAGRFEQQIAAYIGRHQLLPEGGKVIVALSGGADSVALLAVLTHLGFDCTAAHCNFHLRGAESDRDCAFARSVSEKLGADYRETHFDVGAYRRARGISVEMACRDLRYDWFAELQKELTGCGPTVPIAVAHHSDDNAETLMLNLLRGTGVSGLRGMQPKTERGVIRPFLEVSRAQITDYLEAIELSYITDSSNLENDVLRNRLRNIILPEIYRQFPGSHAGLATTIANMAATEKLLADHIAGCRSELCRCNEDGSIEISLDRLCRQSSAPAALLFELLKPYGFNFSQCGDILQTRATSGNRFATPTHNAVTWGGNLSVSTIDLHCPEPTVVNNLLTEKLPNGFSARLVDTSEIRFTRNATRVYLTAQTAEYHQFTFRHWNHADRMQPYGMKGSRLVSDIFSDAHLNLLQKQRAWIVECDGKIIWIPGLRTSAHFTVGSAERQAIELSADSQNCV